MSTKNREMFRPLTREESIDHRQRQLDAREGLFLPTLDVVEAEVSNLVAQLHGFEQALASPTQKLADYVVGTAVTKDEMWIARGSTGIILSSEHGTTHRRRDPNSRFLRKRENKNPDTGVAALGQMAAGDLSATHATMLGRQTGDANNDLKHPFKDALKDLIDEGHNTFVSIHGMKSGHVAGLEDERSFDVVVGIGNKPTPQTEWLSEQIVAVAEQFGLRVGINQPIMKIVEKDGYYHVRIDEDGEYRPVEMKAAALKTTRGAISRYGKTIDKPVASVQIEFADTLRLVHREAEPRSEAVELYGPYLGYTLLTEALKTQPRLS